MTLNQYVERAHTLEGDARTLALATAALNTVCGYNTVVLKLKALDAGLKVTNTTYGSSVILKGLKL